MPRYIRRPGQPWQRATRRVVKDIKRQMRRALGPAARSLLTETVEILDAPDMPAPTDDGVVHYLRTSGRFAQFFPRSVRQRQRLESDERARRQRLQPRFDVLGEVRRVGEERRRRTVRRRIGQELRERFDAPATAAPTRAWNSLTPSDLRQLAREYPDRDIAGAIRAANRIDTRDPNNRIALSAASLWNSATGGRVIPFSRTTDDPPSGLFASLEYRSTARGAIQSRNARLVIRRAYGVNGYVMRAIGGAFNEFIAAGPASYNIVFATLVFVHDGVVIETTYVTNSHRGRIPLAEFEDLLPYGADTAMLWDRCRFTLRSYLRPAGQGSTVLPPFLRGRNKALFQIKNDDALCGQRCLVVARVVATFEPKKRQRRLQKLAEKSKASAFTKKAQKMASEIGVPGAMTFADFEKYTKKFPDEAITIWMNLGGDWQHHRVGVDDGEEKCSPCPPCPPRITHHLIWVKPCPQATQGHYHYAKKIATIIGGGNRHVAFCSKCHKTYRTDSPTPHTCGKQASCWACKAVFPSKDALLAHVKSRESGGACSSCGHCCYTPECLAAHEEKCLESWKVWERPEGMCDAQAAIVMRQQQVVERNGRLYVGKGHKKFNLCCCRNPKKRWGRYIDDHKCDHSYCRTCDEYLPDGHRCIIKALEVNHTNADGEFEEGSHYDGRGEWVAWDLETDPTDGHVPTHAYAQSFPTGKKTQFTGPNCLSEFAQWALTQKHKTFWAHNFKGYDGQLLYAHLCRHTGKRPSKYITAGGKIMMMSFGTVKFCDSLNHIAGTLASMPKTFALKKGGFYPKRFNTPENKHYVGPIPDISFFDPDLKKPEERKALERWHAARVSEGHIWYHEHETRYAKEGLKKGYYPYRFNTPENQAYVGKIPGIQWFDPELKKSSTRSALFRWHAKQSGLLREIRGEPGENPFEWNHAKETDEYCVDDVAILYRSLVKYQDASLEKTGVDPLRSITSAGYCQRLFRLKFYDDKATPLAVLKKDEYDFVREGFHGGRTEVFQSRRIWTPEDVASGRYAEYKDICSLYPSVQYYDQMPLGAPEWVMYEEEFPARINERIVRRGRYGFYKVDLTCPKDLLIPVLMAKAPCGRKMCDLMDKTGVVVHSEELKVALDQGYRITRIHKALVFNETSDKVFRKYIDCFHQTKLNASKRPDETELSASGYASFDEWADECERRFGFRPDPSYNPGARFMAKLCLNSLWGKFGQRPNLPQTKWFGTKQAKAFWRVMGDACDGKVKIKEITEEDPTRIFVKWVKAEQDVSEKDLAKTNLAVAASVTACARVRLYAMLGKLKERAIYCDTDSVIYERDPNGFNVPQGIFLGEWTDECDGKAIVDFVGCGAKSYSYVCEGELEGHVKSKGITLHEANRRVINHATMVGLVERSTPGEVLTTERNMRFVDNKAGGFDTVEMAKTFKATASTKRVFRADGRSVPFGWNTE